LDPAFPRRNGHAFLLFDEGQDSYGDYFHWNGFFKGVGDGYYRALVFRSYGSPGSHPVDYYEGIGTSRALRCISLWLGEILLNRSEFDEVVSRFERPLKLHPDLLHLTFELTVGHTGVGIELMHMISCQVSLF
jgi:hypothetical protein